MMTNPKFWLIVSCATMLLSIGIIVILKPVWGIDFVGGSLLEVQGKESTPAAITEVVQRVANAAVTVQPTDAGTFLVRTTTLTPAQHEEILAELTKQDSSLEELRYEAVGPTIGAELRRKAFVAVVLSVIVTIVYLAYEFRHTGGLISPWKFGAATAIALVHDLLFVTAAFVILGRLFEVPIDALFVTALLALAGYSVNDTIVLFNRLKHEWLSTRTGALVPVIDRAIKLTLVRSLNTSITILLTLLTLLFFGGVSLRWFIMALTIGTIVGSYSTIFVAPPFLYFLSRRSA